MTDRERLEKILDYVRKREDFFYDGLVKHDPGSFAAMQCTFQASSFQEVRYLIEDMLEE